MAEGPPGDWEDRPELPRRPRSPDHPPLPRRPSRGQLWIGPIPYKNRPINKKKNKGLKKERKNERYWERRRQTVWKNGPEATGDASLGHASQEAAGSCSGPERSASPPCSGPYCGGHGMAESGRDGHRYSPGMALGACERTLLGRGCGAHWQDVGGQEERQRSRAGHEGLRNSIRECS